jgi:dipeptidyl aminopeptidase/acylaminoacyl peptidase
MTPIFSTAQNDKTPLDFNDYDIWKKISGERLANNGSFVVFHEVPGKGNQVIKIQSTDGSTILSYERGEKSSITDDSKFVIFTIKPDLDSIRALKRIKTKEDKMPKDSLAIFNIRENTLIKIPNIKSYSLPLEWNGSVVYTLDKVIEPDVSTKKDTLDTQTPDSVKVKKPKAVSKKNGYHLVVRNLGLSSEDTIQYVLTYKLAKKTNKIIYHTSGVDSTKVEGIYYYDVASKISKALSTGEYQYDKLALSEDGSQAAFLLNKKDKKEYIPDYELRYWKNYPDSAAIAVNSEKLTNNWIVNPHHNINFSQNGSKLFFYTAPSPMVKDTLLLEDEIIQVEIWTYNDQRLHTQQNVEKSKDEKKGYRAVLHTNTMEHFQLAKEEIPNISFGQNREQNHRYCSGSNSDHYLKEFSWEGYPIRRDIYLIDQNTGEQKMVAKGVRGSGSISPSGKYISWYNVIDTAFYAYDISSGRIVSLSSGIPTSIVDELDDHPDYPNSYGVGGWTENDEHVLIYDRFDIWKVNTTSPSDPIKLTQGRSNADRYRLRKLDPERAYINLEQDVLQIFNEKTRDESYAMLENNGEINVLLSESGRLRGLRKARDSNTLIYTVSANSRFPDLLASKDNFISSKRLSNANPQQNDRNWSTVEMVQWTSLDGLSLEGLLYKPENFDSKKKYPLIVYFYERNSDNIHRYYGATPIRSIVNPSFYASRGYLIFVPDIVYRDGYPGPSCYNAVIPGITHLIDKGYIDVDHIGMQGHSWGGYQTAYLATRTNMFACAESGAPVSNMISAYGGIRWGTGLSRMFQYERTQSRLGGTLWDMPLRYFENSPIFFIDKINTPMLIMHNDHDTAVPWYQGIELFVAMRRLNKPAWMLNYNNEPHWPTKRENIVDFNIRMQQFFDHYLMEKELPEWMEKGIPAVQKGYNKGY